LWYEAQEVYKEVGDKTREALAWYSIAEVHSVTRQHDAALYAQEQSLLLWKQVGNDRGIVKAMFNLADLYLLLKNHTESEKLVLQLGRYTHAANDARAKDEMSRQILFLRVCLLARANEGEQNPRLGGEMLDKALRAANKALKLVQDMEDAPLCRGKAVLSRAEVLLASGLLDQAVMLAEEAKRCFQTVKDDAGQAGEALAMALIATVLFQKEELREANRLATDAVQLACSCQDWKAERRCVEVLTSVEKALQATVISVQYQGLPAVAADTLVVPGAPQPTVAVVQRVGVDVEVANKKLISMMIQMFDAEEDIHLDTDVLETGLDSLSSLELVGRLGKEFKGVHLSPTLLFDFPCIREIGQHIHEASLQD